MPEDIFKNPGVTPASAPATKPTDPLDHDKDGKKGGAAPAVSVPTPVEAVKTPEPVKEASNAAPVATAPIPVTTPAPAQPAAAQASSVSEPTEEDNEEAEEAEQPSELDFLKKRADFMKIGYASDVSIDTLKAKIKDKMEGTEEKSPSVAQTPNHETISLGSTKAAKKVSLRQWMQKEKMKLVRLRITNMDPKKADLQGEIITVANEYLGTVRKFVPFGEFTDNGFHVPYCIFEVLQERRFLSIKTKKGNHGTTQVENAWVKEFALEILPPLTAVELARLATDQRAAGGIAENAI